VGDRLHNRCVFDTYNFISFGKWRADGIKKKENGRVIKNQSGFKLINREGSIYLGAYGVALLGFCFWLVAIIAVISYNIFT